MKRQKKAKHWARPQKKRIAKKIKLKLNFKSGALSKFLFFVFLGVVIYSFVFSNFLEVTEVNISGVETLNKEDVEKRAYEMIHGKYLGIFPKNNLLLIVKKGFIRGMTEQFKKIESVEVEEVFPNKINVVVKERRLMLVLCSQGECFFVDKGGYAYEKADFESEKAKQNNLIKFINESGDKVSEGDQVLREDFVVFVFNIADKIRDKAGVEITKEYRSKSLISGEVIVQTVRGWDIYLSSDFSIEKSSKTLKTVLSKQISLKEANGLEYIDLRSENKVFYRMRGDGVAQDEDLEKSKSAGSESPQDDEDDDSEPKKNKETDT